MTFPTNVFVLCTGRCGSMTLARACGHFANWTAAHESLTHATGPARLAFRPQHIEIDNRLSWLLGRLERAWGPEAAYVHLLRDPEAVAQSFSQRANQGIIRAYRTDILARARTRTPKVPLITFCRDYVDTANANIAAFLQGKPHQMTIHLETIGTDFDAFCDWIGATGDLEAARAELGVRHNATESGT